MSQTLHVHLRVNDALTGQPTPVRFHCSAPDGTSFAPLGRSSIFPTGRGEDVGGHLYLSTKRYYYIDGSCEIPLPTGVPLQLEVSKGPGYLPLRETVTLGEGQLTLRLVIHPVQEADLLPTMADSRCLYLSPHAARLEASAEGIDFANLLIAIWDYPSLDGHLYQSIPNALAFSGTRELFGQDRGVFVNTFNVHPVLGRLALLNCHRPVYPLRFGGHDATDDWSLGDWCDQCHRKKGLVVWCDAYRPESGLSGGEGLVQAILGKVDAIEIDARDRSKSFLPLWYRLWNAGINVPIVGGSGKDDNRTLLGGMRTLTPRVADYAQWIEQLRQGRTSASNGPILRCWINDQESLSRCETGPSIHVKADVWSGMPFDRLDIVVNGEARESVRPVADGPLHRAQLERELDLPEGGWVAVRAWGTSRDPLYPHAPVFAHSSPCRVIVPGQAGWRDRVARESLDAEVSQVEQWVKEHGQYQNLRRKEAMLSACAAARTQLSS